MNYSQNVAQKSPVSNHTRSRRVPQSQGDSKTKSFIAHEIDETALANHPMPPPAPRVFNQAMRAPRTPYANATVTSNVSVNVASSVPAPRQHQHDVKILDSDLKAQVDIVMSELTAMNMVNILCNKHKKLTTSLLKAKASVNTLQVDLENKTVPKSLRDSRVLSIPAYLNESFHLKVKEIQQAATMSIVTVLHDARCASVKTLETKLHGFNDLIDNEIKQVLVDVDVHARVHEEVVLLVTRQVQKKSTADQIRTQMRARQKKVKKTNANKTIEAKITEYASSAKTSVIDLVHEVVDETIPSIVREVSEKSQVQQTPKTKRYTSYFTETPKNPTKKARRSSQNKDRVSTGGKGRVSTGGRADSKRSASPRSQERHRNGTRPGTPSRTQTTNDTYTNNNEWKTASPRGTKRPNKGMGNNRYSGSSTSGGSRGGSRGRGRRRGRSGGRR